jgi:hypothetical protein
MHTPILNWFSTKCGLEELSHGPVLTGGDVPRTDYNKQSTHNDLSLQCKEL